MLAPESSAFGMKPRAPQAGDQLPVVGRVTARHEHDRGRAAVPAEHVRDLESVQVGELHVEQHQIGAELTRLPDRFRAVLGLADDVESLCLEQAARGGAEARVVVDDEHCPGHVKHRRRALAARPYG